LVEDLLDLTRSTTKDFTPQWHLDFMQGVADGTGNNTAMVDIWRMAMIPELIKASCSIAGMWGSATADGGLIQLRALDWGTDGPFQQYPVVVTYHPDDGSFAHSSLGWVGLYGTLTGWSSSNLAISEKFWSAYKKLDNIFGYPWTFMLQDMLRFDHDIDEALARLGQSVRTCSMWIGLGQGARPNPLNANMTVPANFKLAGDSFEELHFYNPENYPYYTHHDYYPELLFVNKHQQPSGEPCMNDLMAWGYGNFHAVDVFTTVTALEQTGDMHIAVADFDAKLWYISNASPAPNASPAYNNGFIRLNMTQLWSTPAPETM